RKNQDFQQHKARALREGTAGRACPCQTAFFALFQRSGKEAEVSCRANFAVLRKLLNNIIEQCEGNMFSQAMRARTSAIRSFGIVAAALIGLAGPAVAAGPQTVKENTLSVGSDLTYPPFAYMNEGKPAGFDVE